VQIIKYNLYKTEDFLSEESFINYCLNRNPEDVLFWQNLQETHPEIKERVVEATNLFYLLSIKIDPADKEKELQKLKAVIEPSVNGSSINWHLWRAIAAIFLVCVGIAVFFFINTKDYTTTLPVYVQKSTKNYFKTSYNERRTIKLADGSIVILNGLTELTVSDDFGIHNRVLWLSGEAYFKVSKNKDKPFIVVAGKTATTALGTSFKINNYEDRKDVSVMLATGQVNVGLVSGQKIVNHTKLLPREALDINTETHTFSKSQFSLSSLEDWTNRRLLFSMSCLKDIKSKLNAMYGVEVLSKNAPKEPIAFTGEFNNESLTEVLDAIGFSNHFSYVLTTNQVILKFE